MSDVSAAMCNAVSGIGATRMVAAALLSVTAIAAHAQSAPPPPPPQAGGKNFEEHKQKELARISRHLQIMQTLQSCVQAAADHSAMKACNEAAKPEKGPEH